MVRRCDAHRVYRDAPIDRLTFIISDRGSAGGPKKGPSEVLIGRCKAMQFNLLLISHSLSLSLALVLKATSFSTLLVSGVLGHPNLRLCQSCYSF